MYFYCLGATDLTKYLSEVHFGKGINWVTLTRDARCYVMPKSLPFDPEDEPPVRLRLMDPKTYNEVAVRALARHLKDGFDGTLPSGEGFRWKNADAAPLETLPSLNDPTPPPPPLPAPKARVPKNTKASAPTTTTSVSKKKTKTKAKNKADSEPEAQFESASSSAEEIKLPDDEDDDDDLRDDDEVYGSIVLEFPGLVEVTKPDVAKVYMIKLHFLFLLN